MPSEAQQFESDFESMKEFIDDEGRHYYVIQFSDDSGRIFHKQPSRDGLSTVEFVPHDVSAMECMRRIASGTAFQVDEDTNTQQNLRNLIR